MRRYATCLCLWLFAMLVTAALTGCESKKAYNFTGRCIIDKADGKTINVKVILPQSNATEKNVFDIQDRENMDAMIRSMESLLLDLKNARDQMPVVEPQPQSNK